MSMTDDVNELLRVMGVKEPTNLQKSLLGELWLCAQHLHRINVTECNEPIDYTSVRGELLIMATIRNEGTIKEIILRFPSHIKSVRFADDPRGASVKMQLHSGRYNGFGGAEDGWCW